VPRPHNSGDPEAYERSRSGHFEEHRVRLIDEVLQRRSRVDRVVELGCGTGAVAQRLAHAHPTVDFHGVDIDARLLGYARATHTADNLTWWPGLPSSALADSVDLVYSIDVIHHLDDRPAMFAAVRGLLVTGGAWLVVEPNIWHPLILWQQERMKRAGLGEDHFRPRVVQPEWVAARFEIAHRDYSHLWPATDRRLPEWALALERRLEGVRLFGGSVVYEMVSV
jgi:trans-aconitate methyltransferase